MTRLHQLHHQFGQSPWLDSLTRGDITSGRLHSMVAQGIRGVTSDLNGALAVLRPVYDDSGGDDGLGSVELAPGRSAHQP